jgi:uncharacterized protein YjeT (DUF2065 family)
MDDLLVGFGLFLVIEGLLWALAPGLGHRMIEIASQMPEQKLRTNGAIAVAIGVAIVWFVRG